MQSGNLVQFAHIKLSWAIRKSEMNNLFCVTAVALIFSGFAFPASANSYKFFDLGSLDGMHSHANAINNAGQVVGYTYTIDNYAGVTNRRAALWTQDSAIYLTAPLGVVSSAEDINDNGQVVGWVSSKAALWNGPSLELLSGPSISSASGINNLGQVVGRSNNAENSGTASTLWSGGDITALPDNPYGSIYTIASNANAINNFGQIVGYSGAEQRGLYWYGGEVTVLSTLGGTYSAAVAINDQGVAVGFSATSGNGGSHATLWQGNSTTDLGTLDGYSILGHSGAYGINNAGLVVGFSNASATLWDNTGVIDLNSLLDPVVKKSGWVLSVARGINDDGWIVGDAVNSISGVTHAFLLSPVPEPESSGLLLIGLGLVGAAARRNSNKCRCYETGKRPA